MTIAPPYSLANKRVWVAGHRGMVGSAVARRLEQENATVLTVPRTDLDLRDGQAVHKWMNDTRPDVVVLAAAKVGGILANNNYPVDFLVENLLIETSVIKAAHEARVEKLLFLGSSCIYPKLAPQPITEDALLTGPLEPTNEWYAIAKIAGIKLCQAYRKQFGANFISAMPTNLFGPGDNFDLETSHVIPGLMAKMHLAKIAGDNEVVIWGTGKPKREFLHVDDCADALVHLLKNYSDETHVNVGCGDDIPIGDLASLVASVVGFSGSLNYDTSKPDGTPRKLMNIDKLKALSWAPQISLQAGLEQTYQWYRTHVA